jgi:hypothetical protein
MHIAVNDMPEKVAANAGPASLQPPATFGDEIMDAACFKADVEISDGVEGLR